MIEKLRKELLENINALETGATTKSSADAKTVAARISQKQKENELEFFAFAGKWLESAKIKGAKNYKCMLNTLETFLGSRNLLFPEITVRFPKTSKHIWGIVPVLSHSIYHCHPYHLLMLDQNQAYCRDSYHYDNSDVMNWKPLQVPH